MIITIENIIIEFLYEAELAFKFTNHNFYDESEKALKRGGRLKNKYT